MRRAVQRLSKRWFSSSDISRTPVPEALLPWLESAPITVAQVPGAGRGLVASQPIRQGQVILQEQPFLCIPAHEHRNKVCYACLKVLPPLLPAPGAEQPQSSLDEQPLRVGRHTFCSSECLEQARASFFDVERHLDLQRLQQHCAEQGERFPLLALRLACMMLQHAAACAAPSPASGRGFSGRWRSSLGRGSVESSSTTFSGGAMSTTFSGGAMTSSATGPPSLTTTSTASALSEQQRSLRRESVASGTSFRSSADPMSYLRFLCYANVPAPAPQPWADAHALLVAALSQFFESPPEELEAEEAALKSMLAAAQEVADLKWYVDVMSRLHINAFKVDAVLPFDWQDLASVAAASCSSSSSSSTSSGSASFLLASLFNHSCEPNINVSYPYQNATAVFTAARDVDPGEQLTITYIDAERDVGVRQEFLAFAYGFKCQCMKCKEEEAATGNTPQQLW